MNEHLSRRRMLAVSGCGVLGLAAGRAFSLGNSGPRSQVIDRSGADWRGRPMFLRPYHPPYIASYYGIRAGLDSKKWSPLISRVEKEPDLKIRIVEAFDDACAGCPKLVADSMGSVWGVGQSCSSARDQAMVDMVTRTNRRILKETGLSFGDVIALRDLVPILRKNVPLLYEGIGDPESQASYEKGLKDLAAKYGL
ncbi:MAG TPA: hypothetical protein P5119_10940 [Candidatus Aminicenantes bacterium]|nr:hypothetical protein [Candidatus Aminicenantes bacterium]HRY65842.1 hypothetical protein [Candidatus Aminicenantes bacterium]HRZ72832.1 hypothetical protein [Candidatus Aminicenantes bacterium]